MFYRVAAVAILACALAGCTDADWDHTLSYVGMNQSQDQAAAPQANPAAQSPAPAAAVAEDDWCVTASKAAEREAREEGFDIATQRNRAATTLRQCQQTR